VRKAFEQLKNAKLMDIIPRYGAQVAPIDFKYMKSLFEVDRELEGFAARLAADRITEDKLKILDEIIERIKNYDIKTEYKKLIIEDSMFHETVFASCGNPCLVEILYDLHMHTERLWFYVQKDITDVNLFLDTLPEIAQALKKEMQPKQKWKQKGILMCLLKGSGRSCCKKAPFFSFLLPQLHNLYHFLLVPLLPAHL